MRKIIVGALTMVALGASLPGAAETSPEDATKYRQYIMRALSGHAGAISMMTRGLAGDKKDLHKHAEALVDLADEVATSFEQRAIVEDSEALAATWDDPDGFARAVASFENAVAVLDDIAGGGDMPAIDGAFREIGKACKGCHEDYRKDD